MLNDSNKHSWCVNAYHAMAANNDGSTKMCCMIRASYNTIGNTELYTIGRTSLQDNFNNEISERIRYNLDNGIRDGACTACWQEEDGGRKSKRLRDNEVYVHNKELYNGLAKLELNLGNTCNIKCRTCHPAISSGWLREAYDLDHKDQMSFKTYGETMRKFHENYDEASPFWADLEQNLSTIRQFDFYGGEPFLSKKMWSILRICVEKGFAKDISLHYNTNGTNWPADIEELFPHFKSINLSFSIDGIGESFEYMRFPANWEVVKNNMMKAHDYSLRYKNMDMSWCVTLSTINIYELPKIVKEHYENWGMFGLYLNLVHGPIHFNISTLPPELKDQIISHLLSSIGDEYASARYQLFGILGFIKNGTFSSEVWNTFKQMIKKHDMYREQNFAEVFPEYNKIVRVYDVLE